MSVLIAGGNGLIGRALTRVLLEKGHKVAWLVRNSALPAPEGVRLCLWNVERGQIDLAGCSDEVERAVFLAGYPLANGRLDDAHKQLCETSRIDGARLLARGLSDVKKPLKSFVGASAIGV